MFVPRRERGHGLAHELIAAAIEQARAEGADMLEAYPVDPDAPSYRHMGFVSAFERAGFTHAGPEGRRRHVMRLTISAGDRGKP
jgi:GNAT superfamily N-acetyltransferase